MAAKRNPLKIAGQGMAIAAIAVSAVLLVFATASVLVFAVGMGGALEQAHGEARKTRDRVNLHNISIGIMLYVADEGGAYPDSLADLLDGGAYLDDPSVLLCPGDLTPGRLADGAPCSYEYIGALPAMPPAQVIVAYTREGIFPDGRNVLRADATIRWYGEQELSGPAGLLADSYARVVTWLGDDLTEERDAELRSFYGIAAVQEE